MATLLIYCLIAQFVQQGGANGLPPFSFILTFNSLIVYTNFRRK